MSIGKKVATAVVVTALSVSPAFAEIDVSNATTAITSDGVPAITAVGSALIGLAGVAVVFKWIKGAIFG